MLEGLLADARSRVVVLDGGMGSSVEDRGVNVRNALWGSAALLTPEGLAINDALHEEFRDAGAEILTANVHNASLSSCQAFDPGDDSLLGRVNREGVESARRAAGEVCVVAAGIGSAEGAYATASTKTPDEVRTFIAPQARALAEIGVDLLIFETLTTASEIEAVAVLAREPGMPPFAAGLTCGADGRTLAGVPIDEAAGTLLASGPAALFVQCTQYHAVLPPLEGLVEAVGDRTVVGVYANDGREWVDMRWHGERITPERYAEEALRWRDTGARIIGGCCGTTPAHVAALKEALTGSE